MYFSRLIVPLPTQTNIIMKKIGLLFTVCLLSLTLLAGGIIVYSTQQIVGSQRKTGYREVSYPTPNYDRERVNEVQGVILHHTAEPTAQRSLEVLTSSKRRVGTHVMIDTDGTRYIMCSPETVTYHAGYSVLDGREGCNNFTIGIEFQGNTLEEPLTQDQIDSAVEYLLPLIDRYNIPVRNIVTHEMVRNAYKERYPHRRCYSKVDITQTEYRRVMEVLRKALVSHL